MNSLVSVIIPTYNRAQLLEKAINSVINQTHTNWEILIIDNHSSDETDKLIKNFKDIRIKILKIYNNGVIAASRNKGILNAQGDWIAFLDSDDLWYPNKLEIVMNSAIQNKEHEIFITNELAIDNINGSSSILRYGPFEKNFYKVLLLEGNKLSPSATVIKHSFLKENKILFNESVDYIGVEDYDLWLNLAFHDARFKFIDSIQGEFLIHPDNSDAHLYKQRINFEKLLHNHIFEKQKFQSKPKLLWNQISPMLSFISAKQLFKNGEKYAAFKCLIIVMLNHPIGTIKYIFYKLVK